jgi:hypothetical protein
MAGINLCALRWRGAGSVSVWTKLSEALGVVVCAASSAAFTRSSTVLLSGALTLL